MRAAEIADRVGVSPEAALLNEGWISEKAFYTALARWLNFPYYQGSPAADPESNVDAAIASGYCRLIPNSGGLCAVVAPRGAALRYLIEASPSTLRRLPIAIASRQRLSALLRAQFGERLADRAAHALAEQDCAFTAMQGATLIQCALLTLSTTLVVAGVAFAPGLERMVLSLLFWTIFSSAVWLRSIAVTARDASTAIRPLSDGELPVYTVVAPLHHEGPVVGQLARALDALDYPRAKLDIKLVVEREDHDTIAAIAALRLPARYDVIVAPHGAPTTKPRALNIALNDARGSLLVVYDAEDRPDPDQLRLAAARFAAQPELDGLQARLIIENRGDSWLSEMFAVEYAALFDLFDPGLAALGLPIALGGSSNHFRVASLRRAGAWDAWNVTEDADLGIRFARLRLRIETLASDTFEEAPHELCNWFRQRVRWQKGWMQTLMVHTRRPRRVLHELSPWRAASAFALIAGGVSGGLFGAAFMIETLARALASALLPDYSALWYGDVVTLGLFLWGVQSVVVPTALVMRWRRMPGLTRVLLTMPLYFVLIAMASWVALFELVFCPFYWGKTEHGRAKPPGGAQPRPAVEGTAVRTRLSSAWRAFGDYASELLNRWRKRAAAYLARPRAGGFQLPAASPIVFGETREPPMNIALIGASGRAGSCILAELIGRGHQVTAIVRNPEKIAAGPGVTAVKGDVYDQAGFAKLLEGHDAVVSSVRFAASDPKLLIGAVRASGVKRYFVVGGAGSLEVAPGLKLIDTPQFPAVAKPEASKGAEFLELLRGESELEWTFLSPSALFVSGERTGKFRLGGDQLLTSEKGSSISFEDYAVAAVDELEKPAHIRQRFTVGY